MEQSLRRAGQTCSDDYGPTAWGDCDHHGHHKGEAPPLFAGLSRRPTADGKPDGEKAFDVPITVLFREGNN